MTALAQQITLIGNEKAQVVGLAQYLDPEVEDKVLIQKEGAKEPFWLSVSRLKGMMKKEP